jgi:hypothetical protein
MGGGASKRRTTGVGDLLASSVSLPEFQEWYLKLLVHEAASAKVRVKCPRCAVSLDLPPETTRFQCEKCSAPSVISGMTSITADQVFASANGMDVIMAPKGNVKDLGGKVMLQQLLGHLVLEVRELQRKNARAVPETHPTAQPDSSSLPHDAQEDGTRVEGVGERDEGGAAGTVVDSSKSDQTRVLPSETGAVDGGGGIRYMSSEEHEDATDLSTLRSRLLETERKLAVCEGRAKVLEQQNQSLEQSITEMKEKVGGKGEDTASEQEQKTLSSHPAQLQHAAGKDANDVGQQEQSQDDKTSTVKATAHPSSTEVRNTGGETDVHDQGKGNREGGFHTGSAIGDEKRNELARMSPREVVDIVEEIAWVLAQTDQDLPQILQRYTSTSSDPDKIDRVQFGRALAAAPMSLVLTQDQLFCLWHMVCHSFEPSHLPSIARDNTGSGGDTGERVDIGVVARRLVGDKWETWQDVVGLLQRRLTRKRITLLQVLRAQLADGSRAWTAGDNSISYSLFRTALGVTYGEAAQAGLELSEQRLRTLWLHACADAIVQLPPDCNVYADVVLDIRDVALRLDMPSLSTVALVEEQEQAQEQEQEQAKGLGPVSHENLAHDLSQERLRASSLEVALQHSRQCLAIAVHRLKSVDLEARSLRQRLALMEGGWGEEERGKGGGKGPENGELRVLAGVGKSVGRPGGKTSLLGPILEAGRIGTATQARSVLSGYDRGKALSQGTLAINLVSVMLEEAIGQLDTFNATLKHAPPRKTEGVGGEMRRGGNAKRMRESGEAIMAASATLDGLILDVFARSNRTSGPGGTVKIFLSAHGDEFERERGLLETCLWPLRMRLQYVGYALVLVDLRQGYSESASADIMSRLDLLVRLEEIHQSWAMIALLGRSYGAEIPVSVTSDLSRTDGWAWVSALAGRSLTEAEVTCALRNIYSDDAAMTRRCSIYFREEAAGSVQQVENEERWVRQSQLHNDLLSHRAYHCRSYTAPHEFAEAVSSELLTLARKDLLKPHPLRPSAQVSSRHAHSISSHTPPYGTAQMQRVLQPIVVEGAPPEHQRTATSVAESPEGLEWRELRSVTPAPSKADGSRLDFNGESSRSVSTLSTVLQPGDVFFWEQYLGLMPIPGSGEAKGGFEQEGQKGENSVSLGDAGDGLPDYERILDRFLYFVPPPKPPRELDLPRAAQQFAASEGEKGPPPLVLAGPCGCGKTALLRRWSAQVAARQVPKKTQVLTYFSTDSIEPQPITALRHIMAEMKTRRMLAPSDHTRLAAPVSVKAGMVSQQMDGGGVDEGGGMPYSRERGSVLYGRWLPLDEQEVLKTFPEWCGVSASRQSLLVILDCMDRMVKPAKPAPWSHPSELDWLPKADPHVRVILSLRLERMGGISSEATGGEEASDAMRCFRGWRWPIVELKALSVTRREALAERALRRDRTELVNFADILGCNGKHDAEQAESGRGNEWKEGVSLGGVLAKVLGLAEGTGSVLGEGTEVLPAGVTVLSRMARWCDGVSLELASSSYTMHQLCDWLLLFWEAVISRDSAGAGLGQESDKDGKGTIVKRSSGSGSDAAVVSGAICLLVVVRNGLSMEDLSTILHVQPLIIHRLIYIMGGPSGGMVEEYDGKMFLTSRPLREAAIRTYFLSSPAPAVPPPLADLSASAILASNNQSSAAISAIMAPISLTISSAAGEVDDDLREGVGAKGRRRAEVWARMALINYFSDPNARQPMQRVAGEVPVHLVALGCWPLLRDILCSMPVFFALWSEPQGVNDLIRYWRDTPLASFVQPADLIVNNLNVFISLSLPLPPPGRSHDLMMSGLQSSSLGSSRPVKGDVGMREVERQWREKDARSMPQNFEEWVAADEMLGMLMKEGRARGRGREKDSVGARLSGGEVLDRISSVARFLHMMRLLNPAEVQYGRAVKLAHALYGVGHSRRVMVLREQASCLFDLGHFDSALQVVDASLADCSKLPILLVQIDPLPPFPSVPGQSEQRELEDAKPLVIRIAGLQTEEAAANIELRARTLRAVGKHQEALDNFQRAVQLNQLHMHRRTVLALQQAADHSGIDELQDSEGGGQEGEDAVNASSVSGKKGGWKENQEGGRKWEGRKVQMYAKNLVSFANALVDVDRESHIKHAEDIMKHASEVLSRQLGPLHVDVADLSLIPLSQLLGKVQGKWLDSAQTLLRARAIMSSSLPQDDRRVVNLSHLLQEAEAQVQVSANLQNSKKRHGTRDNVDLY